MPGNFRLFNQRLLILIDKKNSGDIPSQLICTKLVKCFQCSHSQIAGTEDYPAGQSIY